MNRKPASEIESPIKPSDLAKITPDNLAMAPDVALYAAALQLSASPRKVPIQERVLNFLYYAILMSIFVWFAAMIMDREPPVVFTSREIDNPEHKVAPGEQVQVRAIRKRMRSCEFSKKQSIVDGRGKRHEFDMERWDGYGPVTQEGKFDEDVTGPYLPLDAYPGRGRLYTTLSWECNMLQKATGWGVTRSYVLEFEIIPRRQ